MQSSITMAEESDLALDLGCSFLSDSHGTVRIDCGHVGSVAIWKVICTRGG